MGIVIKQSIQNTLLTFVGFGIGALNTLYLYVYFLGDEYYGLTAFILSSANLIMPFFTFGVQNTLVKFYHTFKTETQKSQFLNLMLVLPLFVIIPLYAVFGLFHTFIIDFLSQKNAIIEDFAWYIPIIGIFMAYFEIGYAWVKVHLKSVWGNFLKEVGLRIMVSLLLILVYFKVIVPSQFVYGLVIIYGILAIIMGITAYRVRKPEWKLKFITQKKEVIKYTAFIVFSASIGILLLDIDKFMIGQLIPIDQVAFYSVAGFMALTIAIPMRAMHQITHPITTQLMAERKWHELQSLYQKTSITLQVISGWILLNVLTNLESIYTFLPDSYSLGISVVFLLSFSKYFDAMLGNNNSIIFNSKYYQTVLILGFTLLILAVVLNIIFIPIAGIQGVAWATFIAMLCYNMSKLYFVVFKMKLFPFTIKSWYSLLILLLLWIVFSQITFSFHPLISILLKSSLLTLMYLSAHYFLRISSDMNDVIRKILRLKS
jgi:O-antigen/teichoic acid export membrane protein